MNMLVELLSLLPPPYADYVPADGSAEGMPVVAQVLNVFAHEMEALREDTDAMRRTHWVETVFRLEDIEKLGALVGVARLPGEELKPFRARLLATVKARLRGALGVGDIKQFVYDYLNKSEKALDATLVPGLPKDDTARNEKSVEAAFESADDRPLYRPLRLVEYPTKERQSETLRAAGGRVPYLHRWEERNLGLSETFATFALTGFPAGRTATPVIANLTNGDLVGYRGVVPQGLTMTLRPAEGQAAGGRKAAAFLGEEDVTAQLFSVSGFRPGVAFEPDDFDDSPLLPRMSRGANRWMYLSVGLFDTRGLDNFFFAVAGEELRQGAFNETSFDRAIFPVEAAARLEMRWTEQEPASFEVRVPRHLIAEREGQTAYRLIEEGLRVTLQQLHAAGVRASLRFEPFVETQRQKERVRMPWKVLEPETGTAGANDSLTLGGHFGDARFEDSRFE